MTGEVEGTSQDNYLALDTTMTGSDETFQCFVEVTEGEAASASVVLNVFSK